MPSIQFAYLPIDNPEPIQHVAGVTLRLSGTGELDMFIAGLSQKDPKDLRPVTMSASTGIEPTRLCNYKTQRYSLTISTDKKDEFFELNRLVFHVKEIYSQYPSKFNG